MSDLVQQAINMLDSRLDEDWRARYTPGQVLAVLRYLEFKPVFNEFEQEEAFNRELVDALAPQAPADGAS